MAHYPVYIVSKGRYKNPITAKYFLSENIDFKLVIEPQEYNLYKETIPKQFLLCTPFSNLGLGSYPARNYAWEHSIEMGAKKHFLFDDNIYGFVKPRKGIRRMGSIKAERALEVLVQFTKKYKRVAIAGYNYDSFITRETVKPFTFNTHVYSGLLIANDIPFRWRLKYNEDVDLCLQSLHNKYNTILLNVVTIKKVSTTAKLKGGNQDELYLNNAKEKKILKTKSLESIWPQYVKSIVRFGRPHHSVDWKKHFTHGLIRNKE